MWSGLPQLLIFPMMPLLMTRMIRRAWSTGSLIFAASCFLNADLTPTAGSTLILPQVLRAIGLPLFAIPLQIRPPAWRRATAPMHPPYQYLPQSRRLDRHRRAVDQITGASRSISPPWPKP